MGLRGARIAWAGVVAACLLAPWRPTSHPCPPPPAPAPTLRGVLLYGPSGTGKTTLAKSLGHLLGVPLFVINGPEVFSGFVGGSEARIRDTFHRAAAVAPSLVFIDDIDAMCPKREDARCVVTRLMGEWGGGCVCAA